MDEAEAALDAEGATHAFFALAPYHLLLTGLGVAVLAAYWLPRLFSAREPAAAPILVLIGWAGASLLPFLPEIPTPVEAPVLWERVSEICVIVALFATGLRVDKLTVWKRWRPTVRLLVLAMPLTIAALAVLGMTIAGLGVASAILFGAVMAPTDPVLAGDVQVGPPQEGAEHPVRFALTTEAALNDGLAFPFVYFALSLMAAGAMGGWVWDWALTDVAWRICVGVLMGAAGGWLLGQVLFLYPRKRALADTESGVVAIAGVFLCYGSTELAEGYGFISVAVMGFVLRRVEIQHQFHRRLHDFTTAIEHVLTTGLLVALGAVLPDILMLDWRHFAIAALLILVVRPVGAWTSLGACRMKRRARLMTAFYGVRGIGSIYYLSYATSHATISDIDALWSLLAIIILMSTVVHGLSAGAAMALHEDRPDDWGPDGAGTP